MHADILNRVIRQAAQPQQANVRGAAFVAFVALGLIDAADIAGRVPIAAEYEPDPRTRDRYDELFAAFTSFYRRTKGIYARLNGD